MKPEGPPTKDKGRQIKQPLKKPLPGSGIGGQSLAFRNSKRFKQGAREIIQTILNTSRQELS